MQLLLLTFLATSFVQSELVANVPSASDLDGVHILVDNDVNSRANKTSVILLSKKRNYQDSLDACGMLGETGYHATSTEASILALSKLLRMTPVAEAEVKSSGHYWIRNVEAPRNRRDCSSIDRNGKVSKNTWCHNQYPALCSNSAPRRQVTPTDPEGDTSRQIKVPTDNLGTLQGHRDSTAFRFYGIPYAEPPVGKNRFAAPRPLTNQNKSTLVDVNTFGHACTQVEAKFTVDEFALGAGQSEDCLYLNVFTPTLKGETNKGIPVMVYVHGGAYSALSGTSPSFEPGNLVSRGGVVVVTLNYRLGIFGLFQNQPAISKSAAPGNLPTRDHIAALQWVQKNIANFGGNPKQVTIFGESAGGWSMRALLSAPSAFGLYKNVISQSDLIGLPFSGPEFAAEIGSRILQELNCSASDLACAQNKTTSQINTAQQKTLEAVQRLPGNRWIPGATEYRPCVDGDLIPANLEELVQQGKHNTRANILWGHTHTLRGVGDTARFQKLMASPFYTLNSSDPDTVRDQVAAAGTDLYWTCPYQALGREAAKSGSTVYMYQINRGRSTTNAMGAPSSPSNFCIGKTCHTDDIVPSFGSGDVVIGVEQTGEDARFARQVIDWFSTFARTGDPNPKEGKIGLAGTNADVTQTKWQKYSGSHDVLQMNTNGSSMGTSQDQVRCEWVEKNVKFDYHLYGPGKQKPVSSTAINTRSATPFARN
ncbi:hypothetical protein BGZ81_009413 [Podila clonocystis]|nr:hypothetical protein BGZ81_009413 [Podila clonocystis]